MTKTRPFLKWAGSKYNCISDIINTLPPGNRLIEPFAGSGVVFMNADYSSYVLAENNADLVCLYSALQQKGLDFIKLCETYFQPQFNHKEVYYSLRSEFNLMPSSDIKSALFLYLNRHGYNGLCRYNSSGIYNVPFGLYTKPYFPYQEMVLFHQKSKQAQFIDSDFRATFALAKMGDVIYCDPPYVPFAEHYNPFNYSEKKFSLDDQIELAELAKQTAERGIPVIISNHDTEFTRRHYKPAKIKSIQVSRHISCQTGGRKPVQELIAVFNNLK